MVSDDEGEVELDDKAGNKHGITMLGVADSLLLDPPERLEDS